MSVAPQWPEHASWRVGNGTSPPRWRSFPARRTSDVASAPILEAALVEAVGEHDGAVIFDLAATTFVDSAAVSVLIKVWKGLRADERALVLVAPSPKVRAVLEVLGIDQLVPIEPA